MFPFFGTLSDLIHFGQDGSILPSEDTDLLSVLIQVRFALPRQDVEAFTQTSVF